MFDSQGFNGTITENPLKINKANLIVLYRIVRDAMFFCRVLIQQRLLLLIIVLVRQSRLDLLDFQAS